ncbi:MAG: toxin, partial [Deltaproteobacteria bacterium]|nr:toxin [Deltaproteobacteria bacterium]
MAEPGLRTRGPGPARIPGLEARRAPAQAPTPVEVPTPTLPKGGGAIRSIAEKFSANPATGTGAIGVPIAVSAGRSGFGPQLSLGYDSSAGNGPWGLGWSISIPSISRKTEKGLPRYRDDQESDTFILSGAEDLVPVLVEQGGKWVRDVVSVGNERRERYRPRVEAQFARIERVTDTSTGEVFWRATTKDNVTSTYGKSAAARIADPGHPKRIFRWLLEETRDDREKRDVGGNLVHPGNVVRYEYKAEDLANVPLSVSERHRHEQLARVANRYPKRILYGNRRGVLSPQAPADFHFELVYDYGEHDALAPTPAEQVAWPVRQDAFSTYRSGFEIRSFRLCRRVLMFHRFQKLGGGPANNPTPVLVRSTDFSYEETPALSYLKRVTHKGYSKSGPSSYTRLALP